MDAWIAATAVTHGLPVFTQDADFDDLAEVRSFESERRSLVQGEI